MKILVTYERKDRMTWIELRGELNEKFLFDKAVGTRRLYIEQKSLEGHTDSMWVPDVLKPKTGV